MKPARILALSVLVPFALMVTACIADVSDDTAEVSQAELQPEGVHWGRGPDLPPKAGDDDGMPEPIPPGPCRTACEDVQLGKCGTWRDDCWGEDFPDDEDVVCAGAGDEGDDVILTCGAAAYAARGTLFGRMMCFRSCEYLRALLTRFTTDRAMASRSTRKGGTELIFSSKLKPWSSI